MPLLKNPAAISHELQEKNIPSSSPRDDEITQSNIDELSIPGRNAVHRVHRNADEPLPKSGDFIPGYDADLMQARATLSSEEEKKLLRRIDWRLLPLLSLMYMLKSVDFSNVSHKCFFLVHCD